MRKIIIGICLVFTAGMATAQTYDNTPPYQKDSTVPAFHILQADSSWFEKPDLAPNHPLVIVYFNPDCGHCQHTAQQFAKKMDQFRDVTFVWATYLSPLDSLTKFAVDYKLNNYPNVHFGKDLKYFIPSFYRVEYTPFMALYDKKGKLSGAWPTGVSPDELLVKLKKVEK